MLKLDKKDETYISNQDKDKQHIGPPKSLHQGYTFCGIPAPAKGTFDSHDPSPICQECVFRCDQFYLSNYGIKWFR